MVKKIKAKRGRPKSELPTKDHTSSIRINSENLIKIKTMYGSIQKFIDEMIKKI